MHACTIYKRQLGLKDQKYGKQLRDHRFRSIILCGDQLLFPAGRFKGLLQSVEKLVLVLLLSVAIGSYRASAWVLLGTFKKSCAFTNIIIV